MRHFHKDEARRIIREAYGSVQSKGTAVAEALYSPQDLAVLPEHSVRQALGVNHPAQHADLQPGETVLDLGSGAGIDTLLAARRVGPAGEAVGVDMTPEMVQQARDNARQQASITQLYGRPGGNRRAARPALAQAGGPVTEGPGADGRILLSVWNCTVLNSRCAAI